MKVLTASGSTYEFNETRTQVRRLEKTHDLRQDGEWLDLVVPPAIRLGARMVLFLEPLGEGEFTVRTTTEVADIVDETVKETAMSNPIPRFLVIQGEEAHPILGAGIVVDRETQTGYPFGNLASFAAQKFNSGERRVEEGFQGNPLSDTEKAQLDLAEKFWEVMEGMNG